jgi:hypothetical protein
MDGLLGPLTGDAPSEELGAVVGEEQADSLALSSVALERPLPAALVLGVGSADERTLRTGIKRLRRVLRGVQLASGR